MASITRTIRSLRKQAITEIEEMLAAAAGMDNLTAEDDKVVAAMQDTREEMLASVDSNVYNIKEIRYAKQMMKRDTIKNKDKRF